ncbi:hypothetical protein CGLO_18012 [Colletotrichum gloeosporioides Cg-14]|uniref:Uncharacterized protein n=1 Tax=Colletotrichum gloeosporioides (strain Cg-14) TaxID=1237896 RepID=T0JIU9_COLGC|nr:hypothetical protein CGLO_18012 [Colletotrichum gloeosporioides Cg-14]
MLLAFLMPILSQKHLHERLFVINEADKHVYISSKLFIKAFNIIGTFPSEIITEIGHTL